MAHDPADDLEGNPWYAVIFLLQTKIDEIEDDSPTTFNVVFVIEDKMVDTREDEFLHI